MNQDFLLAKAFLTDQSRGEVVSKLEQAEVINC